jgi:signal peptidase I, archaeal type
MKKAFQYLIRWSINLALIAALLLAAAVWLPGLFHMKAYVVKSSSMEPTIMPGSVIYVSPYREEETVSPGDIVSFQTGDAKVTHRVAAVDLEHGTVTTKGDANQVCDSQPITFDAIEGKVRFHIPAIGYLLLR